MQSCVCASSEATHPTEASMAKRLAVAVCGFGSWFVVCGFGLWFIVGGFGSWF
jgi:hypothetical protein